MFYGVSLPLAMFRTELKIDPSPTKVAIDNKILTVGSCFANSIGTRLSVNKFQSIVNPFGILFNPISIVKNLTIALDGNLPEDGGYLEMEGIHCHYDLHSDLSSSSINQLKTLVNQVFTNVNRQLSEANFLIITFGTAIIYERVSNGELVANCHKVPAGEFRRRLLTQKEILAAFEAFQLKLVEKNPEINIILTVSPVRHLKETLVDNSVSKSTLRLAANTLTQNNEKIHYFPAYELLLDDLRDYRFYADDMLHPSVAAEDYIWNKFSVTFFEDETSNLVARWNKIQKALSHKAFHPESEAHQNFLRATINELENISAYMDVSKEIENISSQLK